MGRLFLAVTRDELSLPLAVAGSAKELEEMLGMKRFTVVCYLANVKSGKRTPKYPKYVAVEV